MDIQEQAPQQRACKPSARVTSRRHAHGKWKRTWILTWLQVQRVPSIRPIARPVLVKLIKMIKLTREASVIGTR